MKTRNQDIAMMILEKLNPNNRIKLSTIQKQIVSMFTDLLMIKNQKADILAIWQMIMKHVLFMKRLLNG